MNSQTPKLKTGFTTGTCAQAAAKGAVTMLITGKRVEAVEVETASAQKLNLKLIEQEIEADFARCAVIKDSGDDPDITNGAKICAQVGFSKIPGVALRGGKGVGKVTRPGLAVKVGEYAINPVPRQMIIREVSSFLSYIGAGARKKGFEVIISVPQGEELAGQTFNPRLGIEGGISIIGTTGIVEPKSQAAYKASLSLQLDVLKASGKNKVALVLGYVGEKFCKETLGLEDHSIVKIGDHVGFMFEECARKGIKEIFFAGHIGKLAKVANGQFNTHCQCGDGRLETIARYAKINGAPEDIIRQVLKQETAEGAVAILKNSGLEKTFGAIARAVAEKLSVLANSALNISCYVLSLEGKLLASYE